MSDSLVASCYILAHLMMVVVVSGGSRLLLAKKFHAGDYGTCYMCSSVVWCQMVAVKQWHACDSDGDAW